MLLTVEFIKLLYMYRNCRGSKITLFFLEWKQDNSEAHLWQKLKHKSEYRAFNSVAVVCNLPDPLCVRAVATAGRCSGAWMAPSRWIWRAMARRCYWRHERMGQTPLRWIERWSSRSVAVRLDSRKTPGSIKLQWLNYPCLYKLMSLRPMCFSAEEPRVPPKHSNFF